MARKFIYDGKTLDDPDANMSIDEVRQSFAEFFPELFNASHDEKKDGEDTVITFTRRVGVKGAKVKVEVEIPDGQFCNPDKCCCNFFWEDEDGTVGCLLLETSTIEEGFVPEYFLKKHGCPNPEKKQ